ncbi:hypothetical protein ACPB99_17540 [Streptomyces pseudogriseolus]|uniref:hypothetical protein n=1 Tax=Streptomyces pseudogriseolus TaxID=36817 RepID=UPI003FA2DAA2
MGPSLVIERFEFQRGGVWYARYFKGLVTFMVGHSKAGKSTAVEALLYPLGLTTATVMPEVRSCQYLRLVFRVAGVRWQATRSGSDPRARVSLKNLDDPRAIEHSLAVTSSKATEMTAGAFVQDLLGLSAAVRGTSRAGLDEFYTTVMALRQNTIASEFLGGGKDASRVLALEVVLGLWNEELAGLEKNASETESRARAAQSALRQFKKLRDTGALADPDSVRAECEQKQHEHQAAAGRWQKAAGALTAAVGEHGRLVALHKAADQQRRKAARQAEVVQGKLSRVMADQARTEGELAALLNPAAQDCSHCGQVLPERAPGLCPQCGLVHPGGQDRRERQIATARTRSERLARKVKALQEDMTTVAQAAQEAETAAADALAARDAYDRDHVASARTLAQSAEKEAHGLSRDVAQLKRRLQDADYISAQETAVAAAKEAMEQAQAARDAVKSAQEVRRKAVTGRWSQFFLERLRQINPAVEAASIDPLDFTTRVKEHGDVDKTFADSSVGGSPRAATNVALLLALRDLGRVDPLARVPPLLIIDSPLAGLGATGLDQDTSLRLIDTLISIADDPSADGYACQVIAATNDPLSRPYPGVREIHINDEHRFFDHAPVHAG